MKLCSKCKTTKERSAFNKFKYSRDGLQAQCRDCMKLTRTGSLQGVLERRAKLWGPNV